MITKKTNKKEYKETKIIDNQNSILLEMLALIPDAWHAVKNSLCKKITEAKWGIDKLVVKRRQDLEFKYSRWSTTTDYNCFFLLLSEFAVLV